MTTLKPCLLRPLTVLKVTVLPSHLYFKTSLTSQYLRHTLPTAPPTGFLTPPHAHSTKVTLPSSPLLLFSFPQSSLLHNSHSLTYHPSPSLSLLLLTPTHSLVHHPPLHPLHHHHPLPNTHSHSLPVTLATRCLPQPLLPLKSSTSPLSHPPPLHP